MYDIINFTVRECALIAISRNSYVKLAVLNCFALIIFAKTNRPVHIAILGRVARYTVHVLIYLANLKQYRSVKLVQNFAAYLYNVKAHFLKGLPSITALLFPRRCL